jgi:hypothetical protein
MSGFIAKDAGAAPTYEFDYSVNFLDSGESISASIWTVEPSEGSPSGLQVDSEAETATTTIVRISGGTPGDVYRVINRITTDAGNVDERTLTVLVGQL